MMMMMIMIVKHEYKEENQLERGGERQGTTS
jgi:hypothetical protein